MTLEKNIAEFIKKKGVNLSAMSRETEIPYMSLYDSFFNEKKTRQLKARELVAVCEFLDVSPMEFKEKKGQEV